MYLDRCIESTDSIHAHHDSIYQDGATPLFVAAARGHHEIVTSLLDQQADVNLADKVRSRSDPFS